MKYKYGMKNRPFGIDCQPKHAIDIRNSNRAITGFYDIVIYDRELSEKEITDFELVKIF